MATGRAYERQVRTMLEDCGCSEAKPLVNKHVRWQFKTPAGHTAMVITSRTPSDKRGILNLRAVVRSIIREKDNG